MAFSPDGRTLAAGTLNGVLVWDTANRAQVASLSADSGNSVNAVAFSPDGRTLAAGTDDGLLVWDTANRAQVASLSALSAGSGNSVGAVAFSPDGRALAAGTGDGTVRLLPGELLWRNFASLRDEICGLVPGGLTRAVWGIYAPGLPYEDDCH